MGFSVFASEDNKTWTKCGKAPQDNNPIDKPIDIQCSTPLTGRYLSIQRSKKDRFRLDKTDGNYLVLCEIVVWGHVAAYKTGRIFKDHNCYSYYKM